MKAATILIIVLFTLTLARAQYKPDANEFKDGVSVYTNPELCMYMGYIEPESQGLDTSRAPFDQVNQAVFDWPLVKFLCKSWNAPSNALDWTDTGCKHIPILPGKPLFLDASGPCYRHGFGVRNYKKLGVWNDLARKGLAMQFHVDLMNTCFRMMVDARNLCLEQAQWLYESAMLLGEEP